MLLINPKTRDFSWKACQQHIMKNRSTLMVDLLSVDISSFSAASVRKLRKFLADPQAEPERMKHVSIAAAGIIQFSRCPVVVFDTSKRMKELSKELSLITSLTG